MALNFAEIALQKIKQKATELGKKVIEQTPFADPASNGGRNFWGGYGGEILANQQRSLEVLNQAPRIELPKPQVNNQIAQTGINIAWGIPESIVNTPRNFAVGASRVGTELGSALRDNRNVNIQNLIGGVAPLAESIFDVGTMGLTGVGKNIAKQGAKTVLEQGVLKSVGKGALKGAGVGAAGGLTYGLDTQYGKDFNAGEVLTNILSGAALGGVAGGGISAVVGIKSLITRTPEVEVQLRDKAGRWTASETPVKPAKMPKPQWEFQIEFNRKYNRNPYTPVMPSDLEKAFAYETNRRVGFQARDINLDKNPLQPKGVGGVDPLVQEARKYKSAEEFSNGMINKLNNFYSRLREMRSNPNVNVDDYIKLEKAKDKLEIDLGNINRNNESLSDFYNRLSQGRVPEGGVGVNQVSKATSTTKSPILESTKLETPKTSLQTNATDLSVDPSRPIIPVGKRLESAQQELETGKITNTSAAQLAQDARSQFSPGIIKDINLLKNVSRGKKFQMGDVETYRKEYPQITERVVQAVRTNPQYENITDSEALLVALELPTKQMTKIKRPDSSTVKILSREEQLENKQWESEFGKPATPKTQHELDREWEKYIDDYSRGIKRTNGAVSVEPSSKIKSQVSAKTEAAKVRTQEAEYNAWQKEVFGEGNTRSTNKAIDDLLKSIKSSTNEKSLGIDNADNWKNKSRLSFTRETMERNFEDIMGSDAPVMKKKILEPIFDSEAQRTKFLNKERAEIKALGIAPRSKDSAILQDYGEGKLKIGDVRKQSPNADKIIKAEQVLRQKYDSYLTQLNTVLTRNGYDPIPKRKDYFHHFQDLQGVFEQVGVSIKATDLPTDINGLSADFKPGKTFFNAALQRKGPQTSVDAITGIDKYLDGASNQIFHTDNIQRLREFEKVIREKYAGTDHLTNFVAELTEYTNKLAGKKSMVDRAAEAVVGRKIYAGANALKRQVGANMVGANVSSAMTNFIPITQTLATTDKKSVAQAMLSIIRNTFKDDGFVDSSNFLTSRVGSDRLAMTNWEKIGKGGNWLFKTIDSFTSQLAVRSKYLEGLKKGMSEADAMKAADSWGRKTMGGRSAGEMPTLFNSQTLGFLTQFQLEVNNQMSFMAKDIPRNFNKLGAASALGQLFVYSYIYNSIYEQMTGRRPAFDPLGVAQKTYEDYTNPDMKKGQATKNLISNVSQQVPFAQLATEGGRIPITSAVPDVIGLATGEADPIKEASKFAYLLPPTGGGQIKKTVEGLGAFNQGVSTSPSGAVRFPIPQTPENAVRTGIFGQWSTPEAQTYIREGRNVLGKEQSQLIKESSDKSGVYKQLMDKRRVGAEEDRIKEQVKTSGSSSVVNDKIFYMKDGEVKTINMGSVKSMPSDSAYQKALKEDKAFEIVTAISDSGISPEQKSQILQELGISQEDAVYYDVARQTNDLKTLWVNDEVGRITAGSNNRGDLINYLVSQRKEVNGKMVLADGVLTDLVDQGIISKSEQTMLKNLKIVDGKPVTKLSGRGKKTTLKKVSAPPAAKKFTAPNMKSLLAKTTKLKVKRYKFRRSL